jgi:uncharacterized Zn finger protein (UPF0148 family)
MAIKFKCPNCKTPLEAADVLAGEKRSCPMCGHAVSVPKTDSENQTEPEESAKKEY